MVSWRMPKLTICDDKNFGQKIVQFRATFLLPYIKA